MKYLLKHVLCLRIFRTALVSHERHSKTRKIIQLSSKIDIIHFTIEVKEFRRYVEQISNILLIINKFFSFSIVHTYCFFFCRTGVQGQLTLLKRYDAYIGNFVDNSYDTAVSNRIFNCFFCIFQIIYFYIFIDKIYKRRVFWLLICHLEMSTLSTLCLTLSFSFL